MKLPTNIAPITTAFILSACSSTGGLPQFAPATSTNAPIGETTPPAVQCLQKAVLEVIGSNSLLSVFEEGASTTYLLEAGNEGGNLIAGVVYEGNQTETWAMLEGAQAKVWASQLQNSSNKCGLGLTLR